ncbi:MAG: prepilin peptidase, partial [Dehalococcoidia bacterium]|nr:prepilin peptidase [Dehalococcoidia bacterium]
AWPGRNVPETLVGGACALAVAVVVRRLGRRQHTQGVGRGDVKLAAAGGMVVGHADTLAFLLATAAVGGVVALTLLALGRTRRDQFAYGPCLAIGVGIAVALRFGVGVSGGSPP